jgi:hypothetical protein
VFERVLFEASAVAPCDDLSNFAGLEFPSLARNRGTQLKYSRGITEFLSRLNERWLIGRESEIHFTGQNIFSDLAHYWHASPQASDYNFTSGGMRNKRREYKQC